MRAPKLWEQLAVGLGSALLTRWAVERWLSWRETQDVLADLEAAETPGDGTDQSMPGWWSEPILSGPEVMSDLLSQLRKSRERLLKEDWYQALLRDIQRRAEEKGDPW